MYSSFCGAHGLNKRTTTLSMTGVSGGSIKPSLQMDLNYTAINKDDNAVCPVRVDNEALPEISNYNYPSCYTINGRFRTIPRR